MVGSDTDRGLHREGLHQGSEGMHVERLAMESLERQRPAVAQNQQGLRRTGGFVGYAQSLQISCLLVGQLAAVVHEEAAHAGELVVLTGLDLDGQLLVGQVGTGQLERLGRLGLVLVDLAGVLVVASRLQLFDALFALVVVVLARCVVVSRHFLLQRGVPVVLTSSITAFDHVGNFVVTAPRLCTISADCARAFHTTCRNQQSAGSSYSPKKPISSTRTDKFLEPVGGPAHQRRPPPATGCEPMPCPGLRGDQHRRRSPRGDALLEVAVETALRDVAQVEGAGSDPPDVADPRQQPGQASAWRTLASMT